MSARDQVLALQKRMSESIIGQEHIIERLVVGAAALAAARRGPRVSGSRLPPLNPPV